VKPDEAVLVFTDLINKTEVLSDAVRARRETLQRIAEEVAEAGRAHCKVTYLEFTALGGHGKEPPEVAWVAAFGEGTVGALKEASLLDKILDKTATVKEAEEAEKIVRAHAKPPAAIVALSNFSSSHTRFRDFLTRCCSVRYASMPNFEESMLEGVMRADWSEVERCTLSLCSLMEGTESVEVTSPNGTSISFSIAGRPVQPDTGILTAPGTFGNLPAGEAFTAPVEGSANGTLVLEWAPTRKLDSPVTLTIVDGIATSVEGTEEYTEVLRAKLAENRLFGNIAELGIGTNSCATRPDNILETEKILGSIHIALGDNSSFGGKVSVPFHQDFIFFKPTMTAVKSNGERVTVLDAGAPKF
ncbi:MAG: aminopeptidase, partial [Proteobacteria bacterium]|nr:aminopeptidase [Pseudomonadota bacterium]